MRLLILFISFLVSQVADSQIINASQPYRARASGCSYLLDQYSGAAAAYSLRLLDCQYAGSAIRVRRSSDNTESDIGFVNGNLDTATLKTFVGTGGTDDGFITVWYDQTDSRDAVQATSGNQPRIMNDGVITRNGTKVAIEFLGASYLATSNTGITTLATHSQFMVFKEVTSVANAGVFIYTPASGDDYNRNDALETEMVGVKNYTTWGGAGSAYQLSIAGTRTLYQLIAHIISAGSGEVWQNGTSGGTDSYGSFAAPGGYILLGVRFLSGSPNTTYGFKGYMHEIITYNSEQSANRTGIQSNINAYWVVY